MKTCTCNTRLSYTERTTPAMTYIKSISAFLAISYQCEIGFLGMPIKIQVPVYLNPVPKVVPKRDFRSVIIGILPL